MPSEARLNIFLRLLHIYLQHVLQTIIYTLYCITKIWSENIYFQKLQSPPSLVIESWSPKTKICTELVITDGPSV